MACPECKDASERLESAEGLSLNEPALSQSLRSPLVGAVSLGSGGAASPTQLARVPIPTGPSIDICLLNTAGRAGSGLCQWADMNQIIISLVWRGEPRTLHFSITVLCTSSACRLITSAGIHHRLPALIAHDWIRLLA